MAKKEYTNFSITLYDITDLQKQYVAGRLAMLQQEIQDRYGVDGGDFVGQDSGTIDA